MPSFGSSSRMIFGLGGQCARDRELLLLTARQHAAIAIEIVHQIGKQLGDQRRDLALAVGAREGTHQDVLADREIRNDLAALRNVGDSGARPAKGRLAAEIGGVEPDLAVHAVGEAHQCLEQRGLAGAVAAEDRRHLAVGNVKADIVQDVAAIVEAVDMREGQHQEIPFEPR